MRYWFTSDTHYGHSNIIKYCNRPFKDCDEMNATMIRNFNARVKDEDTTFIIGDFCFKSGLNCAKAPFWLNQLKGNKIIVRGNHDNNNSTKTIIDCIHVTTAGTRFNLVHKPEHCNLDFPVNLVGHVHDKWKIQEVKEDFGHGKGSTILFNVGVDVNKFYPISMDEIISQISHYKKSGKIK